MPEAETGSGDAFGAYLISMILQLRAQLKVARKLSADIRRRISAAAIEPEFDEIPATGIIDLLDVELDLSEKSLAALAGSSRFLRSDPPSAFAALNDLEVKIDRLISLFESEQSSVIQLIGYAATLRLNKDAANEKDSYRTDPLVRYVKRVAVIRVWVILIYFLIVVSFCYIAYVTNL